MKKWLSLIILVLLVGCEAVKKEDPQANISSSKGSLRIMYPYKELFMNNFGYAFQLKHPGIDLEILSSEELARSGYKSEDVVRFIMSNRPDIIVVDPHAYQNKNVQNMLLPLERSLQQDNIKLDSFVPSIISFLNDSGEKPLYGLAPSFDSQAIYWNKELFDRYGVSYPNELMSWEDVLIKAKKFKYANDVFGLYEWHPQKFDPFTLFYKIIESYRIDFSTPQSAERLVAGDPFYRTIWDHVISAYQGGYVYNPLQQPTGEGNPGQNEYKSNLFLQGKAAMYVDSNYFLKYLRDTSIKHISEIKWELAVMPVNPHQPNESHYYNIRDIYGINSSSTNVEEAWLMLRHIHSDETARTLSKYDDYFGISAKLAYAREFQGRDLSAFYHLKPIFERKEFREYDMDAASTYRLRVQEISRSALDGTLTSEEALKEVGKAIVQLNNKND